MIPRLLILIVVFTIVLILVTTKSFAEESFNGYSSIDPPLSEVIADQSTVMTIRFLYTSGPYAIYNLAPVIDVNPSSAGKFVKVDVDSIEVTQGQIKRIPVTLTIDPHIEHDKIFLSISYAGNHFMSGELQKSSWNDQIALDVKDRLVLEPKPEQDKQIPKNCGPGTTLQDGICVVDKTEENSKDPSMCWGGPACNYDVQPPLKQIKSSVALFDVQCPDEKYPVYKYNRMRVACVFEETQDELWSRGWATMRFYTEEDTSPHALCNNYEGKWHPEHNGCRGDISDLQCSLMGGKFVDNLKICYNDICPENKTYTLCVINSDKPSSDVSSSEPPPAPTQCRPGLPPFTSDFYLDKELCDWKLIPEPVISEAIPYVWNAYLQKRQIDFSPEEGSYVNADEGYFPEKENRVCSPLVASNGAKLYISSTFTIEPFEIIDTIMTDV